MKLKPIKNRVEYGGCLIGKREENAILKTVQNQGRRRWTIGPQSVAFEKELAQKTGVDYAVLVNSGSSALLAAIQALKLPKGSKVIIPALNFPTAYSSILQAGYMPVVVDCDIETLNLSFKEVERALNEHPDVKAVVAVHVAGNVVDLITLRDIVGPERFIVSDNCDAYGSTLSNEYIDVWSDVSCISMHAAHIISMGEGGAVLTNIKEIADRARKIREWGRASGSDTLTKHEGFPPDYRERYVFEEMGYNLKPLELQCAMGRIQLRRLESFKKKRRANYTRIREIFSKYPETFRLIKELPNADNCWFAFPFLCEGIARPKVMEFLESMNIEVRTVFSGNILKHPAYKDEPHIQIGDLSNANEVMVKGMFIGTPPILTKTQLNFVEKVIEELVNG